MTADMAIKIAPRDIKQNDVGLRAHVRYPLHESRLPRLANGRDVHALRQLIAGLINQ